MPGVRLFPPSLIAAVVVAVGSVAWFTSTSHFFFDDYIYFREAQREGLSLRFLAMPLNVHLSPGHRLADWFLQRFFPLDFAVAQVLLLACLAGSMLVLYRLLVRLFGPGTGAVVLTLLYGTSLVHVGVIQWWSASLQSLPSSLLGLVCILAWLAFHQTGSRPMLVLSVAALGVALLFYVKPVLLPLELILMRVLVVEPERPLRETVRAALGEWRYWLAYLAPVALYAIVYVVGYWQPSSTPTFALVVDYLRIAWVQVFVPSVIGFHVPPGDPSALVRAGVVAAQLGVIGLATWSIARWRPAWRGWAFLGIAFLANALLVGVPRLADWGSGIAWFYRYYPETTYLLPVALGAAFLRPARAVSTATSSLVHPRVPQRTIGAGLAVAVVVHLALVWSASVPISEASPGRLARGWIDNVREGLERARRDDGDITVVDGTVPEFVVASWSVYGPPYHDRLSEVLPLVDPDLAFDRAEGDLWRVTGDGSLSPVAFAPQAGGWAPQLLNETSLRVSGGVVDVGPDGLCILAEGSASQLELRPARALVGPEWYLGLQYLSRDAWEPDLEVRVDRGWGFPALADRTVSLEGSAQGDKLVSLGAPPVQRIRLDLPAGSHTCLGRVEIGDLVPRVV